MVRVRAWRFEDIWNTPSMPLLLGPHWPGVVVPFRVSSVSQTELFNHLTVGKQMAAVKLNCWCYIAIHETLLTVSK